MNNETCSCTQCATDEDQNQNPIQNNNTNTNPTQIQNTQSSSNPHSFCFDAGQYKAKIETAKHKSHKNGHDVIQMWLEAEDSDGNTEMIPKSYNLNSNASRDFTKRELAKIGVDIQSREDVLNAPGKLQGLEVDISLGYSEDEYPVVYFDGLTKDSNTIPLFDPNSIWED